MSNLTGNLGKQEPNVGGSAVSHFCPWILDFCFIIYLKNRKA